MDIAAINSALEKLPQEIRDCQLAYLEAKNVSEKSKLKLEVAMSMALLKSQQANATRQKAEAVVSTENEKKELLNAELEETKKECELDYRLNNFTAVRKIASLLEKGHTAEFSGF